MRVFWGWPGEAEGGPGTSVVAAGAAGIDDTEVGAGSAAGAAAAAVGVAGLDSTAGRRDRSQRAAGAESR